MILWSWNPVFTFGQNGFDCSYDPVSQHFQIRDLKNGKNLIENIDETRLWLSGKGYTIGGKTKHTTHIAPVINVSVNGNGFDIEYIFENTTHDTASLGELHFGRVKLDSIIYARNTTYTFQEETYHAKRNSQYVGSARVYPSSSSYSPVAVFRDKDYIYGISVVYPFMEYHHTINLLLAGANMSFQPLGWDLFVQINKNHNGEKYYASGELAPGQKRIYKMYVRIDRVNDPEQDWKKVIQPYKTYFQEHLLKMEYVKDRRPVIGYHGVSDHLVTDLNPYGYWNPTNDPLLTSHPVRPDQYGFGPVTDYLNRLLKRYSFQRLMYWAPTGLYRHHPQLNYPFQFMSRWKSFDNSRVGKDGDVMQDGINNFIQLASMKYELGFWWGHAIYVSRYWDSPTYEKFDPSNKDHWELSFKEMRIAKQAHASCVGLDSFNELTGWDQVTWLDSMASFTDHAIKFVSETYTFDVIHTKAAFYYADWNAFGPHVLADFLVPGNEKWMHINPEVHTPKMAKDWAKKGYSLCVFGYLGGPKYPKYKAKKRPGDLN